MKKYLVEVIAKAVEEVSTNSEQEALSIIQNSAHEYDFEYLTETITEIEEVFE